MRIRTAQPADLEAVVEIYNAAVAERIATADTEPVTVEQKREWFEGHDPQRRPLWVAEESGQVVGWMGLQDFYGRPAYHITAEFSLYVHPLHRRGGTAKALMEHALAASGELGLRSLIGFVFTHNQPIRRLLERFGFMEWGRLPEVAEMDGVRRDVLILGRAVGDYSPSPSAAVM